MYYTAMNDRRRKPRSEDLLFRIIIGLNAVAWIGMFGALILFHYARPEYATGVQQYWGMEGRNTWAMDYVEMLAIVLQVSLGMALITLMLRMKRNRRKTDSFGVNLFFVAVMSIVSLVGLSLAVS